MSRYSFDMKPNPKLSIAFKAKFDVDADIINVAFGFDTFPHPGYFLQICYDKDEMYLEDGFINTNKNNFLDKLERYGLLEEVKTRFPKQFNNIILDLPA